MLIRGSDLNRKQRRTVLDTFQSRWTRDNPHRASYYGVCPICRVSGGKPQPQQINRHITGLRAQLPLALPRHARPSIAEPLACTPYHPISRLLTDREWLRWHKFEFEADGRTLARRGHRSEPQAFLVPFEERPKGMRYP